MSTSRTITAWAIQRGSTNLLDGHRTYLDGDPVCASRTRLFRNRAAARDYAKQHYSYIKDREDLQREPHGWHVPRVVRVTVTIDAA
jgi:hypothetical protein